MGTYKLNTIIDQQTGELGLVLEGIDLSLNDYHPIVTTEGILIAHDILEHNDISKIGRIDQELEALGATWLIRGQYGNLTKQYSYYLPNESIAQDILRMFVDYVNYDKSINHNIKKIRKINDSDIMEMLQYCTPSKLIKYCECEGITNININTAIEYNKLAYYYLHVGMQKAKKRYNNNFIKINYEFWEIVDLINNNVKNLYEGETYKLYKRNNKYYLISEFDYY